MNIHERDAWLDEVVQSRASGGQFKVAWLIANAVMKGNSRVSLMNLERQIGTIHRRSVQRALQWLEWRGLLYIESGKPGEPKAYTLLSLKKEAA
jgi:hypothetical protein